MNLNTLGWNEFFADHYSKYANGGYHVARVAAGYKKHYLLYSEQGEFMGEITGKMLYSALEMGDLPVTGDWVVARFLEAENKAIIHGILPRKTRFTRKNAGYDSQEQVIAANVDTVFLVMGLDHDFNVRRLERYLLLTWRSGCQAVIVLNKADLCNDINAAVEAVSQVTYGLPVIITSTVTMTGIKDLSDFLTSGHTISLLGSSGVGKSSLINCLAGSEIRKVQEIRAGDGRGRHTTTTRELIILSDAVLMDTPGMRELQMSGDDNANLADTFDDIQKLAANCYFRDCQHQDESDCAVRQAIEEGRLDPGRLRNYLKLQKEINYAEGKREYQRAKEQKFRQISKFARKLRKHRERW